MRNLYPILWIFLFCNHINFSLCGNHLRCSIKAPSRTQSTYAGHYRIFIYPTMYLYRNLIFATCNRVFSMKRLQQWAVSERQVTHCVWKLHHHRSCLYHWISSSFFSMELFALVVFIQTRFVKNTSGATTNLKFTKTISNFTGVMIGLNEDSKSYNYMQNETIGVRKKSFCNCLERIESTSKGAKGQSMNSNFDLVGLFKQLNTNLALPSSFKCIILDNIKSNQVVTSWSMGHAFVAFVHFNGDPQTQ